MSASLTLRIQRCLRRCWFAARRGCLFLRRCDQSLLDKTLERKRGGPPALLVDSLICGAGGMKGYPPAHPHRDEAHLRTHGVLFIAYEGMTRSVPPPAPMFACEQAGIAPDTWCRQVPQPAAAFAYAATCARRSCEAALVADRTRTFFHQFLPAKPLACAAPAPICNLEDEPSRRGWRNWE